MTIWTISICFEYNNDTRELSYQQRDEQYLEDNIILFTIPKGEANIHVSFSNTLVGKLQTQRTQDTCRSRHIYIYCLYLLHIVCTSENVTINTYLNILYNDQVWSLWFKSHSLL